jgi:hypothetical protein
MAQKFQPKRDKNGVIQTLKNPETGEISVIMDVEIATFNWETPKENVNGKTYITGTVRQLGTTLLPVVAYEKTWLNQIELFTPGTPVRVVVRKVTLPKKENGVVIEGETQEVILANMLGLNTNNNVSADDFDFDFSDLEAMHDANDAAKKAEKLVAQNEGDDVL